MATLGRGKKALGRTGFGTRQHLLDTFKPDVPRIGCFGLDLIEIIIHIKQREHQPVHIPPTLGLELDPARAQPDVVVGKNGGKLFEPFIIEYLPHVIQRGDMGTELWRSVRKVHHVAVMDMDAMNIVDNILDLRVVKHIDLTTRPSMQRGENVKQATAGTFPVGRPLVQAAIIGIAVDQLVDHA